MDDNNDYSQVFNTIAKPADLLEPELRPHFTSWQKKPGPETSDTLLKAVDPIIKSALRTYAGGSNASPTLKSKAKLLVLDSLPRYDPSKAKLRTYLMTNLQSLRRASAEENQIISVPERVRLDQQKVHTANAELSDRLGREPSDKELSRHVGISLKRLAHIRKAQGSIAEGQLDGMMDDSNQTSGGSVPVLPRSREVYLDFIYGDLAPIDQYILERSLGMHGHRVLPKSEIARKLGITSGAVSQRAAKIQSIIDKHENMHIAVI